MGNRILVASVVTGLGVLLAVTVKFLLPPCHAMLTLVSGAMVPMKCHWSSQMIAGLGVLIACEGILLGVMRAVAARQALGIVVMLTAMLAMAVPTVLIGVCDPDVMPCRMGMLPATLVIGVLLVLAGIGNTVYLWRKNTSGFTVRS